MYFCAYIGETEVTEDGETIMRVPAQQDDMDDGVTWGDTQELNQQIEAANLGAEDLRGQGENCAHYNI